MENNKFYSIKARWFKTTRYCTVPNKRIEASKGYGFMMAMMTMLAKILANEMKMKMKLAIGFKECRVLKTRVRT